VLEGCLSLGWAVDAGEFRVWGFIVCLKSFSPISHILKGGTRSDPHDEQSANVVNGRNKMRAVLEMLKADAAIALFHSLTFLQTGKGVSE
jgi:hypothetical protein